MSAVTGRATRTIAWTSGSRRIGSRILITYVPLVILLIFLLAPFYWMIITSFKPDAELYNSSISPLVVWQPTLDQFKQLFELTPYLEWAGNSIVVSSLSTGIALLFGLPAG
jgi:multiple sugar transport system permease protein